MKTTIDKTKAPSLTDFDSPWIVVEFIHSDNTPHNFYSVINEMTGNRLSAFDTSPPTIDQPLKEIRSIIKKIQTNAKDVKIYGSMKI